MFGAASHSSPRHHLPGRLLGWARHRRPGEVQASEEGNSPISTVFGVLIFLAFLMLATQVLLHLYTTSTVTAVAFDAARKVAADGRSCDTFDVEGVVRDALGDYGARLQSVACDDTSGEQTVVRVVGPTPARLVDAFGGGLGVDRIDRAARVRSEDVAGGGA